MTLAALAQALQHHAPRYGHDPQRLLLAAASSELPFTEFLLQQHVVSRMGAAKLRAFAQGLLDLDDLSAGVFLKSTSTPEPTPEPAAQALQRLQRPGDQTRTLVEIYPAGSVLGKVEIERALGVGGTSVVFLGHHRDLHIPVVLKVLKPDFADPDDIHYLRFRREAQIAARLDHPSFVRVFDCDLLDDCAFITMEYVEGPSLHEHLAGRTLPPPDALSLLRRIADVLAYAHTRGVIHRDLKPHNILITAEDELKITDFGLATIQGQDPDPLDDTACGTPNYIAPEQIRDMRSAGPQADLYALGVMTFEFLCGQLPFTGDTSVEILQSHMESPPPWSLLPASVDDQARALLRSLLHKDPQRRPAHAGELVEALDKLSQRSSSSRWTRALRRALGARP